MCRKTTRSIRNLICGTPQVKLTQITQDIPLQTYFKRAYKDALSKHQLGDQPADDSTDKLHVPITLIAYAKSGDVHSKVGIYQDEMHFSASLLKAGVMYAAFKLLAEAETLAGPPPPAGLNNQNVFFAALQKQFNSSDAVPEITKVGAKAGLVPRYADILKVEGFGTDKLKVTFVPEFYRSIHEDRDLYKAYLDIRRDQHLGKDADGNKIESAESRAALARVSHMYKMVVWSNNTSAGECIRRLGYAYINVKLMEVDLFDKKNTRGIWIGGDYVGIAPRIEVDSVNDDKVATATTTRHMAELFLLIKLDTTPHSDDMQFLIGEAQDFEPSFISRAQPRLFTVGGVKIGVANIKPNTKPLGPDVNSEGIIFSWNTDDALPGEKLPTDRGLSGIFAACWQNVRGDAIAADKPGHNVRTIDDAEFDGVAEVIQNTIKNFIKQTALP
jgi:hypothetical protein